MYKSLSTRVSNLQILNSCFLCVYVLLRTHKGNHGKLESDMVLHVGNSKGITLTKFEGSGYARKSPVEFLIFHTFFTFEIA